MQPFEMLEQEWARFNGLDPAGMVACSSGTAALHLALEAFQLPPGSEVIVPDYGMIACPRAVTLAGLTPVFVDCDERLLMDERLAAGIQDQPKVNVAMFVHVYGRKCNMLGIYESIDKKNLLLVEDLAEAHGIKPHKCTDAACWSFYRNKIVAGEEGGAAWFRDPKHAELARSLRCLGFTDAHDYRHLPRGHNYRMSNAHANLILHGGANALDKYPDTSYQRWKIEAWYDEFCPDEWRMPKRDAVWVYDVRVAGLTRAKMDGIVGLLKTQNIQARHGFAPMTEQEEYRGCRLVGSGGMSRRAADEVFYLPCDPATVTRESCARVFDGIKAALR